MRKLPVQRSSAASRHSPEDDGCVKQMQTYRAHTPLSATLITVDLIKGLGNDVRDTDGSLPELVDGKRALARLCCGDSVRDAVAGADSYHRRPSVGIKRGLHFIRLQKVQGEQKVTAMRQMTTLRQTKWIGREGGR